MMKPFILILSLFCTVCFANEPGEPTQANLDIQEWQVPWPNTRPRDPAVDSTGNVWFCGQGGNYIAVFNPKTKTFKRFELSANTHPHNLIIDSNDNVWYAGNGNNHIGKLNPKTGDPFNIDECIVFGTSRAQNAAARSQAIQAVTTFFTEIFALRP